MRTMRFLLMCLIVLALPLQGFAAVGRAQCHHGVGVQVDVKPCNHAQTTQLHQMGKHVGQKTTVHLDHKCSNCAQCCLSTPLAATLPVYYDFQFASSSNVESLKILLSNVTLKTIERPPQSFVL